MSGLEAEILRVVETYFGKGHEVEAVHPDPEVAGTYAALVRRQGEGDVWGVLLTTEDGVLDVAHDEVDFGGHWPPRRAR